MTQIYTRSGDDGSTGLADGTRVSKTSVRIEAIGTVDECNSHLGKLVSLTTHTKLSANLVLLQHQLFDLGATLADTATSLMKQQHVGVLEQWINDLDQALPPLKQFILPGGDSATAQAHITRAVCRRAERGVLRLAETELVPETTTQFLNRLSDYLFVVARTLARLNSVDRGGEIVWLPEHKRG